MPTVPDQISRRCHPILGDRGKFLRMPRVPQGFLDVPLWFAMEMSGVGAEELAVREDCSREAVGEPVEGYGVENFGDGRGGVGPGNELLADPMYGVSR